MIRIIEFLFIALMAGFYFTETTNAFYTANISSNNNSIHAGTWGIEISHIQKVIATPNNSNAPKAIITWNTNDNATGNLEWRIDPADLWTAVEPEDTIADATSHSREIEGLLTNTRYYYRVRSKDGFGYETVSAEQSFVTGGMRIGDTSFDDIVINEFLPNPIGDDAAPMPNGEWVELYNRGVDSVDLTGWYLTDSISSHVLSITFANTIVSGPLSSGLTLAPNEFMVIYRNGDGDFSLNNDSNGDQVNLYNSLNNLIDQYIYNSGSGDTVLENKSFARFPDGSDTWFDPIPTPGKPNILQSAPTLSLIPPISSTPSAEISLINDKKAVSINLFNLSGYLELSYELTYIAYDVKKGAIGNGVDISCKNEYRKEIDLATCSSGVCTYDEKVHDFTLKVTLTNQERKETMIEKNL